MANYAKLYTILDNFEQFRTIVDNFWKMIKVLKNESATRENKNMHADMHAYVSKEFVARVQPFCKSHISKSSVTQTSAHTQPVNL